MVSQLAQQRLYHLLPAMAALLAARKAQGVPPGRCVECKDRPAEVSDPWPYTRRDERRRPFVKPEDVMPCACGFQPEYLRLVFTDELTGRELSAEEAAADADATLALADAHGWQHVIELERERHARYRETHRNS